MRLTRRLLLAPAFLIALSLYYFFYSTLRDHANGAPADKYHLHLASRPERHPVKSYVPLPTGKARAIPRIQHDFSKNSEKSAARKTRSDRQAAVKESFIHAWEGYKKHAWGRDEVTPLSGTWRHSLGGWGATLVDSMDTLWMMGLKEDFERCVKVVNDIDFTTNTDNSINVFETTIRYLGGILAAYDISEGKYPVLLDKARELGDILYMAFDTPNRMPASRWEWQKTAAGLEIEVGFNVLLAELGSLTLEFTRLAQLTHEAKYYDAIQRITTVLAKAQSKTGIPGLWPTMVNIRQLEFNYNHFTLGGMVDSAYEYLPKQYLLLGGLEPQYQTMYETAIEVAKKHLFYRPLIQSGQDILFSGNAAVDILGENITTESQAQHLGCFVGGMVGIASQIFSSPTDLPIARRLVDGCIWAYNQLPTGLMPEISHLVPCQVGVDSEPTNDCVWSDEEYYTAISSKQPVTEATASMTPVQAGKYWFKNNKLHPPFTHLPDNRYILRPEAIESIFILYRITGDSTLLDSAWTMFENIERATRTKVAHAAVFDVRQDPPVKSDRMESFWLAETLKYFWLIFADTDVFSLDEWVFNTEAHPFRRPKAGEMMG